MERERKVWGHLVNDNRLPGGRKGSAWKRGRYHLHLWTVTLVFEWSFWRHFCHIEFRTGMERDICFSVAVPGVALWLSVEDLIPWRWLPKAPHRLGISIHGWAIWFDLWQNDMEWDSKRDRFRHFNFNIPNCFFGRDKYSTRQLSEEQVLVPMPEGAYPATVIIFESTWKRPCWPWPRRMVRADIEMQKPIPIPGKGENSWDCDEDAIYSMTTPVDTVEKAIASIVEDALTTRRKRGGQDWRPEPKANSAD